MIDVFVTNLGKYNEGELCGEYLKLPAEKEDVQALLSSIGVDGVLYEEFFITDYDCDIDGLCDRLGEYESLDELNYLAYLLEYMDEWDIPKFEAALKLGEHTSSVMGLINLAQNLDGYEFYPDVENEADLGRFFADEVGTLEIPEHLEAYIDYEAYGRDIYLDGGGMFTSSGYIFESGDSFIEHYDGRDVPEEYRIFAYPDPPDKMPMREQLEMFGKMAERASGAERPAPARMER